MNARFDIFSREAMDDPHPLFSEIRERSPVCQIEPNGWWAVTRYQDVTFVLKHPELFSSANLRAARDSIIEPRLRDDPIFLEESSIVASDPPAHSRLRKLINGAFAPKAMLRLEDRVRAISTELIDAILGRERFDLLADFAVPLPVIVIAEMLGVDPARRADFKRWSDDALNDKLGNQPLGEEEITRILRGRQEFRAYFKEMIRARTAIPREDLISELCHGEGGGEPLSADEVLSMTILLLIAGNETTTNLLGNGMLALLDHPESLRRLREEPALIPGFVEEALRYNGSVKLLTRRATEDVTLSGVTIPKGAIVLPLVAAANRDPEAFPDPDRFDITRNGRGHVAFGYGIHFCVGAPLSRMEGRIAFGELLRRLPAFAREPGRLEWNQTFGLRGLKALPLRFTAAA